MQIFVSSTCYDLVDLRAEIGQFLTLNGATPLLSDRATSDFEVQPDRNSIDTCLANVRKADALLLILCRRYGPRLGKSGFPDVSATHLEYLDARKEQIPTYVFVRDRLDADYASWKKNGRTPIWQPHWASPGELGLFEFLDEQRKLADKDSRNWFWTFSDSVDLKAKLATQFKRAFEKTKVSRLAEADKLPVLMAEGLVRSSDGHHMNVELRVRNLGPVPALSPLFQLDGELVVSSLPSLEHGQNQLVHVPLPLEPVEKKLSVLITYRVPGGAQFWDIGDLVVRYDPRKSGFNYVRYLKTETVNTEMRKDFDSTAVQ